MDSTTILVVFLLVCMAVVITVFTVNANQLQGKQGKNKSQKTKNANRMEFSKVIMGIMLTMWVLGGFVGFWVVVCEDFSLLMDVQNYVSYPVTASIGMYGAKSGVENWKKLSLQEHCGTKEEEYSTVEEKWQEEWQEKRGVDNDQS